MDVVGIVTVKENVGWGLGAGGIVKIWVALP